MKNFLLIILAAFIFTACDKTEIGNTEIPTTLIPEGANFQEEVPQYNIQIRSLNPTQYVKEISLMTITGAGQNSPVINFESNTYIDNGRHHDLEANDGIYTSTKSFAHNAQVPYVD